MTLPFMMYCKTTILFLIHSDKTLDIVFASAQESKILGISKGYPLLRIESTIYNTDCSLVQRCKQLCIGDKFKFTI